MKRRPVIFASAAVVALWSGWIVMQGTATSGEAAAGSAAWKKPPQRPAAAAPAQGADRVAAVVDAPLRAPLPESANADAFAARDWQPPPPPPPPAPPPPPPAPPAPPPAPVLPTLPYRFVGLLDEGAGAKPRVFLSLGDKLLVASAGESLEGGFRLDAISGQELVFTHLQQNITLRLSVQGGSS